MKIGEKCGIILTHDLYDGIDIARLLKNRGKESTGFAAKKPSGIDVLKWKGDASKFSKKQAHEIIYSGRQESLPVIGHVRYSTSGTKDLSGAHPHFIDSDRVIDNTKHIIARNAKSAIVHNGNVPDIDETLARINLERYSGYSTDTEKILAVYNELGEEGIMNNVLGSYCLGILDSEKDGAIILRDRFGFRPLWIGEKSGKTIAASEDSVITQTGGFPIREVSPGEIIIINPDGSYEDRQIVEPHPKICMFEFQYFSRWETLFYGRSIRDVRYREGEIAADEFMPEDIDIVTYIPNTPRPSAEGYARALKQKRNLRRSPLLDCFYKQKSDDRTFMEPEQCQRDDCAKNNLYLKDNITLQDKTVLVIDDSIVRSTNLKRASELLRERGAKKVYVISLTPPIGLDSNRDDVGCHYGVDMPPGDMFAIKRYGSPEGIAKSNRIDHLHYLTLQGMIKGIGVPEERLCLHCIGGADPIEDYKAKHKIL